MHRDHLLATLLLEPILYFSKVHSRPLSLLYKITTFLDVLFQLNWLLLYLKVHFGLENVPFLLSAADLWARWNNVWVPDHVCVCGCVEMHAVPCPIRDGWEVWYSASVVSDTNRYKLKCVASKKMFMQLSQRLDIIACWGVAHNVRVGPRRHCWVWWC